MPLLPFEEGPFNPFETPDGAKPEGLIVTRDERSPPIKEGGPAWSDPMGQPDRARPSFGETLGSSFRLENEIVGGFRSMSEDKDFGDPDPEHNPWDTIGGTKYQDYWQHFTGSKNAKETEYIRLKLDQELEDRRIRDASGVTGFLTDMIAAIASPTTLIPGGAIYKGYKAGYLTLRSAASVGAMAAASVTAQELMLQQQQLTRTWQESMLNIAGGTLLGAVLGGGVSHFSSAALRRAAAQVDAHIGGINAERARMDATPLGPDEPPFVRPGGAAVTRPIQENVPEGAFGLERVFAFQGPMPRVMAGTIKTARDVMSRLAEMTGPLRQNKEGIATGPAGGSVELRIKVDGDLMIYKGQEGLYKNFAEYRFGNRDAAFARGRAAFTDLAKPKPGVMDWRTFKSEVTRALREQTEKGIEHPVPQVKAAAEVIRKEVFDPFKKEAIKLGLFPKEAEFDWNYVMRRWDVSAILNDYPRFKQILLDHLRGGQAKAAAELARIQGQIDAIKRSGDLMPEVESLRRQLDAERAKFAVDKAALDGLLEMWRLVVKEKPKKPLSLVAWLKRNGGLRDEGNALAHMLGGRREAGRLINNKRGMALDDAALRAFEKGYFTERPTISDLLDAIDEDVRGGGVRFSDADAEAAETWRIAQEYREEIARLGLEDVKSEKKARRIITQHLREEAKRGNVADADAAFLDELAKADLTPEERAVLDAERMEAETRAADEAQARQRGLIDRDPNDPVFAVGVPADMVRKIVESGRTYRFSDDAIAANLEAVAAYAPALPQGTRFGTFASIGPSATRGSGFVTATFRTMTGDVAFDIDASVVYRLRAFHVGSYGLIVPVGVGDRLGPNDPIGSGIWHEVVHAHFVSIDDASRLALVSHADALRVLDMQFATFMRVVGVPGWEKISPDVLIRDVYDGPTGMYRNYPNKQAKLEEEAVAHMQELHFNGHFSDDDVAPVLDLLLGMRGGTPSKAEGFGSLDMPMGAAKADAATGQSMARSLDALGYYSQALEATKRWGQAKGTPEQFLAHLKKMGVKDAEIETLGLKDRLAGETSVTKQDMLDYVGENREYLIESSTTRHGLAGADQRRLVEIETEVNRLYDEGLAYEADGVSTTPHVTALMDERDRLLDGQQETAFHGNSLDRDNPTYRETVLHLPEERYGDMGVEGHFPEPNIIGHMQTSLTTKGNARVFTIDQIQSDWGQRIRDNGVRDDARRGHLRDELDAARAEFSDAVRRVNDLLPADDRVGDLSTYELRTGAYIADRLRWHAENIPNWRRILPGYSARLAASFEAARALEAAVQTVQRIRGEIRAHHGAMPPHPLVNTTDQWLNTTLRRAVRQAIEADAEYIAIPTGDTVLGYNPGNTKGMREFYGSRAVDQQEYDTLKAEVERASFQAFGDRRSLDQVPYDEAANDRYRELAHRLSRMQNRGPTQTGIVPKNLRNILQKIDKTIVPEFVETLDSPSGKKNLGQGFTVFPLTDKVKQSVMSDGLPMFALHAGEPEAPRVEIDPRLIEGAQKLAERLGVTMPNMADIDIDQILANLSRGVDQMMGRAERGAKMSKEDMEALMKEGDALRALASASDAELDDIVNGTIAKLTGMPGARNANPYDPFINEGKAGPLHARTLKIPDAKVVDFLDDDIERVALHYVRAMAPDVALAREFGDINLTEDIQRIQDEINTRIGQAATPAERNRIYKEGKRTVSDIQAVVARLRGTFNPPHDPTAWGPRAATVVKQMNILRFMGAVVAASISDVPKLLFQHGFRHNFDLFSTFLTNIQGARLAKSEAKEASAGLEFVMSRAGQMWDTFDDLASGHTVPEKALRYMTNKMGRINLMDAWNSHLKQLSGVMTANRVLRAAVDLTNGRISAGDLRKLAASGISPDIARVIAEQYNKHGSVYGRLFLANSEAWDDLPEVAMAKQALKGAVRREADLTIVTPGQEKPLWTSTHLGSVIGQFRTFQLVSIQRTLIAGLQEADAAKVVALSGMIALGMLSEQLKIIIHGKEQKRGPKDMGEWLYAGLANSGALGWLMDADQTLHKISGGNVSLARQVFGNERPISRFASQNAVGSLLGPTFGAANDLGRSVGAGLSGKGVTEGDIHAMRRLMFYQNLFYVSRPLRALEEGMIDALGIPRAQQRN